MIFRIFDTKEEGGLYAASLMERVIQSKSQPVLGLATGSTVLPVYRSFVGLCQSGLDVSQAKTINLDEYIGLDETHQQSYHFFMNEHLFQWVQIKPENVEIPRGNAADLDAECARYDEVLRANPIDLQLLGIGENGHIGFNEPDDLLVSRTHVVNLTEKTITSNSRFFNNISDVPRQALTMGVQSILQAGEIVLMAWGKEKAGIVARAFQGGVRTDVPASILQLHKNVTIVLDRDSAKDLSL